MHRCIGARHATHCATGDDICICPTVRGTCISSIGCYNSRFLVMDVPVPDSGCVNSRFLILDVPVPDSGCVNSPFLILDVPVPDSGCVNSRFLILDEPVPDSGCVNSWFLILDVPVPDSGCASSWIVIEWASFFISTSSWSYPAECWSTWLIIIVVQWSLCWSYAEVLD